MPNVAISIVASVAFVIGAAITATACFLRWRFRKQIVPSSYWKRLVDDYGSMEEAMNASANSEYQLRLAHEEFTNRLTAVTNENERLHDQLQSLQTDLAVVTNEATLLVDGLRDNEERWALAEDLRTELEFAVSQLHEAKKLLEEKLNHREDELSSAKLTIAEQDQFADRCAALEAQLGEAAERDQGNAAVIARLERLGGETTDQLRAATRRAETAQWQLSNRATHARSGPLPSSGAFENEIGVRADAGVEKTVIDLGVVEAVAEPAVTPQVFDRGRNLQDRIQRSYGRLPAPD